MSLGYSIYKMGDKRLSDMFAGRINLVFVNTKLAIVTIIVVLVSLFSPKSTGPLLTGEGLERQ